MSWNKSNCCRNPWTEQTVSLLAKAKQLVPEWTRIMRVQRDVPVPATVAGPDKGNLRELVWAEMDTKCRCIRCREAGTEAELKPEMVEREYKSSGATELFLSWEDKAKDKLIGFLRLRLLERFVRPELQESAIVRELRVYGPEARIGEPGLWQHKGLGRALLREAERIAREEFQVTQMVILSGVGAREYYRAEFGYSSQGNYMVKQL